MIWDVFISHASEDKDEVARPLADALQALGLRVWLDEQQIGLGDSVSRKINDGLALSRYGVLVVSPVFLKKDYPQLEMQALLSRQTASDRYILPILHKIDQSLLKRSIPLLSDRLSISTDQGIGKVAAAIKRAVEDLPLRDSKISATRYFQKLNFPRSLSEGSLEAIEALRSPVNWNKLTPVRDMSRSNVWMGTENRMLVETLYSLYAPLVHFTRHRYSFERSQATMGHCERLRFRLIEAAAAAPTMDHVMAATAPRLQYSPRKENWRQLRVLHPAQYWWQGVTRERLQNAVPYFYEENSPDALPSISAFTRVYEVSYRAYCEVQQTLGLLANPLYAFTPKVRPVFWRILALWHCIYSMLHQIPEDATLPQLRHLTLSSPWIDATFPAFDFQDEHHPEVLEATKMAVRAYARSHIVPMFEVALPDVSA